ncbi:hypothetical protein PR202_ga25213 [Eleusine coracana subsp. coracana]|uniref:Uncharacterized protein n=1 Tax=Eleusine coracana subsp. coracana TaxID=191504 RepID=A0AAV5DAG1_ELECO|nr:hypothetical protein PR202_ga25213 [Eleusine coracana subsp. coracana]
MHAITASDSPPSQTKISFKTRSSTQDKSGSNEQGKQPCGGTVKGGDPGIKNNEVVKKKPLIVHIKKRSTKELSTNSQPLKSEFVGEPSEEKLEKRGSALKLKKHPSPMDLSPDKSKSKRQNSQRDSKRSAAKKSKYAMSDDDSVSSAEPSTSLDNSESPQKRKQLDGRTPISSTKKGKKKVKFVDRKNSEVDRILGCRLQTSQINPPSQASSKQYESNLQLDDMAPSYVSSELETSHDISNRFNDGIQSSSNGLVEDVCADESSNHDGDNHLDNEEIAKERNDNSRESMESASINGEDEKTSDIKAEKDDTKTFCFQS